MIHIYGIDPSLIPVTAGFATLLRMLPMTRGRHGAIADAFCGQA